MSDFEKIIQKLNGLEEGQSKLLDLAGGHSDSLDRVNGALERLGEGLERLDKGQEELRIEVSNILETVGGHTDQLELLSDHLGARSGLREA